MTMFGLQASQDDDAMFEVIGDMTIESRRAQNRRERVVNAIAIDSSRDREAWMDGHVSDDTTTTLPKRLNDSLDTFLTQLEMTGPQGSGETRADAFDRVLTFVSENIDTVQSGERKAVALDLLDALAVRERQGLPLSYPIVMRIVRSVVLGNDAQ